MGPFLLVNHFGVSSLLATSESQKPVNLTVGTPAEPSDQHSPFYHGPGIEPETYGEGEDQP